MALTSQARGRLGIMMTAAFVMVASACGSTVHWSETVAAGGSGRGIDNDGPIDTPRAGEVRPPDKSGNPEDPTSIGPGPSLGSGGSLSRGTTQGRSEASTPGESAKSGPGFTAKEIYIGYGTANSFDSAVGNLGGNSDHGKQDPYAKAVAKYINAHGGIAGRKIVLVFHDIDTVGYLNNPSNGAQAACEAWTNDRRVFAATNFLDSEVLAACLARRKVVYVLPTPQVVRPERVLAQLTPYLYAPTTPSIERIVRTMVSRADALGYFNGWDHATGRPSNEDVKIGVLANRSSYGADVVRLISQELRRHGRTVAASQVLHGDPAQKSSQVNNAAVRFRNADVTHVIPASIGLRDLAIVWEQQRYRPRYALGMAFQPRNAQGEAPEQLARTLGVGYNPMMDVDNERDPGAFSSANTRCREIMKNAGLDTSSRDALALMLGTCAAFDFLDTAVENGGLSVDGVRRGAGAIGAIPSAATFGTTFRNGRADGAAAIRDIAYRDRCECFEYVSENRGM